MSFFKTNQEAAAKQEGGNYVTESGIYDIDLKHVIVDVNDAGGMSLNFNFDLNGQDQTLYGGLRLTNNDGKENFQANTFNKLLVIAGLEEVADPIEAVLPIGKEGADKEVMILDELTDFGAIKMRVQMEYSKYNGDYTEKKIIKSFYREDDASADEIINETEVGVKLGKDEAFASNITYKESVKGANDAPTAEEIAAWIAGGRKKGTAGASGAAAPAANKPKFGKKFAK